MKATLLGKNTVGVLAITIESDGVTACATWQPSPIEGAPTLDRLQLAVVLLEAADYLGRSALDGGGES